MASLVSILASVRRSRVFLGHEDGEVPGRCCQTYYQGGFTLVYSRNEPIDCGFRFIRHLHRGIIVTRRIPATGLTACCNTIYHPVPQYIFTRQEPTPFDIDSESKRPRWRK